MTLDAMEGLVWERGVELLRGLVQLALDAQAEREVRVPQVTGNAGRKPRLQGGVSPEVALTGALCCSMYCRMMLSGAPPQDAAR